MPTTSQTRSVPAEGDQRVELRGIGWEGYTTMLRLRSERPGPRMIYLDGDLLLTSPCFRHERIAVRLGMFVMDVVVDLDIPCVTAGRTTFRRKSKRGGVEGDQTFYLANEERIRGKDDINLRVDPPPDLAIEVAHTHDATAAVEVYRRFGVPEVWVCDEEKLQFRVRRANGRYAKVETSAAFPFLKAAEIFEWVNRPQTVSETEWLKEVRRWVRETLIPRREGQGG